MQKILAAAGLASRRKAEELIAAGAVSVNGHVITEMGTKADPRIDEIRVDGKLLRGPERHVYLAMYKPKGVMTTVSDPEGRPTVMDYLKSVEERVFPVGRLDYMSEGLLLLTNDGELMSQLTKAGSHVAKTYMVKVAGKPSEEAIEKLRQGILLPPEPGLTGVRGKKQPGTERRSFTVLTQPATIELAVDQENPWYEVTLTEGRNRQLRRMFEQVGHHIEKIKRIRYGTLTLDLEPGEVRSLSPKEVATLRSSLDVPFAAKSAAKKKAKVAAKSPYRVKKVAGAKFVAGRRGKPSADGEHKSFARPQTGERKSFARPQSGERKSFVRRDSDTASRFGRKSDGTHSASRDKQGRFTRDDKGSRFASPAATQRPPRSFDEGKEPRGPEFRPRRNFTRPEESGERRRFDRPSRSEHPTPRNFDRPSRDTRPAARDSRPTRDAQGAHKERSERPQFARSGGPRKERFEKPQFDRPRAPREESDTPQTPSTPRSFIKRAWAKRHAEGFSGETSTPETHAEFTPQSEPSNFKPRSEHPRPQRDNFASSERRERPNFKSNRSFSRGPGKPTGTSERAADGSAPRSSKPRFGSRPPAKSGGKSFGGRSNAKGPKREFSGKGPAKFGKFGKSSKPSTSHRSSGPHKPHRGE